MSNVKSIKNTKTALFDFIREWLASAKKPVLILLGHTASGKTALSIEIAKEFKGEIISADSRQVYRHMDIGTDKIPLSNREGIPHYMIDIAEPSQRFTAADFKLQSEKLIDDILNRRCLPMLVGGTGLYIAAVNRNFAIPPQAPDIRKQLEEEFKKYGKKNLYEKLKELDPQNAAKIHPNNAHYVIRALEIFLAAGKPKNDETKPAKYDFLKIGLRWLRETLYERINARVDQQIKNGLIEETKKLLAMGCGKNLSSMSSLGYRETIKYLEGELTLDEATALLKQNTRNYGRRQMTWFKRDKDIAWFDCPLKDFS